MNESIRLSVCITTRNREAYVGETLENILAQCPADVEVVVVDGASTDRTVEVIRAVADRHAQLRLITPQQNSGLDADFDKAVQAARGTYCWLFSDDDLLAPGAIAKVLVACADAPTVVVVDASVHGPDFRRAFNDQRLPPVVRERYGADDTAAFFRDCAVHLTFIGAVVVRRDFWLARERARYYGSEFIHCGVLFQAPIPGIVRVLREALVKIRYGVGNWSDRAFDVWMYKWPRLVWSFDWIDAATRASVSEPEPWRNLRKLLTSRAAGQYGWAQFRRIVEPRVSSKAQLLIPLAVAATPGWLSYLVVRRAARRNLPNSSLEQILDSSPHRFGRAA